MKKTLIALFATTFILISGPKAFAATKTTEIEPNNSMSQAQTIDRNNEDYSSPHNRYFGQSVVSGDISDVTDQDWYKVYLPANDNTILGINSEDLDGTGYFDIYDKDSQLVKSILNRKDYSVRGATPFKVSIPKDGYYYINVHSNIRTGSYLFFIGTPDYELNDYTYNAPNSLTLTPTINSVQANYDLRGISSVPEKAVVYDISVEGRKQNYASDEKRSIKLDSDSYWTDVTYDYSGNNVAVINKKYLQNIWSFKLDGRVSRYKRYYSFTPQITFRYVYPVLPR